jgi:hypothetical protein
MNWLIENFTQIMAALSSIIAAASAIAALTPSPKDDSLVARIRQLVDILALNIGHARRDR